MSQTLFQMEHKINHVRRKLLEHDLDAEALFLSRIWTEYLAMRNHVNLQPAIGEDP